MNTIEFKQLVESDVLELTPIMKRSFDRDSQIHLGEQTGGPTGYDNGDFLRKWGLNPKATSFKIIMDGKAVGGIILWINPTTNINFLGNIFIDVDVQDKGIGLQVWNIVEKMYPDTILWKTETPIFSHRNHNFYVNKCGFHVVRIENPKDLREGSFILEKKIK